MCRLNHVQVSDFSTLTGFLQARIWKEGNLKMFIYIKGFLHDKRLRVNYLTLLHLSRINLFFIKLKAGVKTKVISYLLEKETPLLLKLRFAKSKIKYSKPIWRNFLCKTLIFIKAKSKKSNICSIIKELFMLFITYLL